MRVRTVGKTGYYVDFTDEIERGVAVLERHDPRWFDKVNLDRLSLDDPGRCVLGQLAMESFKDELDGYFDLQDYHYDYYDYYRAVEWLSDIDETDENGVDCGFAINHVNLFKLMLNTGINAPNPERDYEKAKPFYNRAWEQLTEQWAVRIEKCRADAGTMTGGDR